MSTDALPTTDRARYFDLAVFPEDVDVPVDTVGILWRHTGRLEGHQARDLLRSFERKSLLTLSGDGERVSPGPLLQTFECHTDRVMVLAVLPDGRALSGSNDRTLRLWDLARGESRVLDPARNTA